MKTTAALTSAILLLSGLVVARTATLMTDDGPTRL